MEESARAGLSFCNGSGTEGWSGRDYGEKYRIVTGLLPCSTAPGELHGNAIGFPGYPRYKIGGERPGERNGVQIGSGSSYSKAALGPGC